MGLCSIISGFSCGGLQNGYDGKGISTYCLKLCCLGPLLPRKILEFKCDSHGLVDAIDKGSLKEPVIMHLLRCLWIFPAIFEITIRASHTPGVLNTAADKLPRHQAAQFLCSYSNASHIPTPIPILFLGIVSPICLDWTSRSFMHCFMHIVNLTRQYPYCAHQQRQ